jgi:hypothetical protein
MANGIQQWWAKAWPPALTIALIGSIGFGLIMAWAMDDPDWLWFCAPIFLFLS